MPVLFVEWADDFVKLEEKVWSEELDNRKHHFFCCEGFQPEDGPCVVTVPREKVNYAAKYKYIFYLSIFLTRN